MLPPDFRLARYRLTLKTETPLELPPHKGSALRGGFGHTLKRLVCSQPWPCDKYCELKNACPYGYIFETSPPEQTKVLRKQSEVPRPFVIQAPLDRRLVFKPGERLTFGLTLVGQGNDYLPYFVAVFRELGRVGLGQTKGTYSLRDVIALNPFQETGQAVYQVGDQQIRQPSRVVDARTIADHAARLSPQRLTLEFLSPTRLKSRGRWVFDGPPFAVLVRSLLSRISSLSYFHCGQRFETDFRGLIDRANEVNVVANQTDWQDWSRRSGRQQQWIKLGGLVGRITYTGDLSDYLPLLALGELIHVGKGTVFGNGQYRIVTE